MRTLVIGSLFVAGSFTALLSGPLGCSADDNAAGGAASGTAGSTSQGGAGGDFTTSTSSGDGGNGGNGGACAQSESTADLSEKPVDIIFVVGNNGSLSQEIAAVKANINQNFAAVIGASGVDYRVILISESGSHAKNICVEAPLSGTPVGECVNKPDSAEPDDNPPIFYHYSAEITPDDAFCKVLSTYDGTVPDQYGHAPNGWKDWLRDDAFKVFVLLSDSRSNCTYMGTDIDSGSQSPSIGDIPQGDQAAADFDTFLLGLSALHFGTANQRNYTWHSIVGLAAKNALDPTAPWLPSDEISIDKCNNQVVTPGIGYQAAARLSGGLRFPLCESNNFDVVFNTIAQGIITGAAVACDLPFPEPPPGQTLDPDTLQVEYDPGNGDSVVTYDQVADLASCDDKSFYVENDRIILCPEVCASVQSNPDASLSVKFGCKLDVPD